MKMHYIVIWQTEHENGVEVYNTIESVETFCNRQTDWTILECYHGRKVELEIVHIATKWRVKQ